LPNGIYFIQTRINRLNAIQKFLILR